MTEAREQRLLKVALLLACLLPLLPVALVPVPPLLDYPNHLARLWLIAGGAAGTPLAQVYAIDWSQAWTNIGIDLMARWLGPWIGADAVGRIAIGLALVLPITGLVLLGRVLAGRWHALLLAAPLLAWSAPLVLGFLNQQIAVGLALLAAAADAAWPPRPWAKLVARVLAGLAIAVVHPFGALFLAALLGAIAIGPVLPRGHAWIGALSRAVLAGAPVAGAVLTLLLLAPHLPGGDPRGFALPGLYVLGMKLVGLFAGFITYDANAEIVMAAALLWAVAMGLKLGLLRGHAGLLLTMAGLLALLLALPTNLGDAGQMELRFGALAVLAGCAGLLPGRPASRSALTVVAVLLLLGGARTLWMLDRWQTGARDVAAVERALATLPSGAALLSLQPSPEERPPGLRVLIAWTPALHYPLLAVPLRQAFVPTLFSAEGKQPLRVLSPWHALSVPDGVLPEPHHLQIAATPLLRRAFPYLSAWRRDFDHLLLVDAEGQPAPAEGLELLSDEGFARLYRIPR
ncbi:hypothetical protein GXW71_11690 [Roseomonas hellenica]|uniref:Glycosyltransferase RgtA/B/C/D-like domain-containing protein n=1 Tax=Plastoroseomonas hellenica TaxID=2687306 RepID=A0ABS5EXH8_9PROT|nr:hypothetical protein [Plastoroseomonas hellenica]MBR0665015.1 hypothetical protein [Plastoroseomonas hellenica]